jgi:hypothetical protein
MTMLARLWAWVVSWFKPKAPPAPVESPQERYRRELVELARYVREERWREVQGAPHRISAEEAQRLFAEMQTDAEILQDICRSATLKVCNDALERHRKRQREKERLSLKVERAQQ